MKDKIELIEYLQGLNSVISSTLDELHEMLKSDTVSAKHLEELKENAKRKEVANKVIKHLCTYGYDRSEFKVVDNPNKTTLTLEHQNNKFEAIGNLTILSIHDNILTIYNNGMWDRNPLTLFEINSNSKGEYGVYSLHDRYRIHIDYIDSILVNTNEQHNI